LKNCWKKHFDVQHWGIYLFNEKLGLTSCEVHGVSDVFVENYEKVGRAVDPVLRYVVERHAPAHEELVLPPGGWNQCELYQHCWAYYSHEHIMTGPIVGAGRLMGTTARISDTPAFSAENLADLSALCLHISASLARLQTQASKFHSPLAIRLTPRELQIAELVAQGLTNASIGATLWITEHTVKQALKRMFRQIQVSSRTQMVALLSNKH
jgi:DNA-binding CsgD family transcriptional regulator